MEFGYLLKLGIICVLLVGMWAWIMMGLVSVPVPFNYALGLGVPLSIIGYFAKKAWDRGAKAEEMGMTEAWEKTLSDEDRSKYIEEMRRAKNNRENGSR